MAGIAAFTRRPRWPVIWKPFYLPSLSITTIFALIVSTMRPVKHPAITTRSSCWPRSLGDFDPGALTSLAARKAFWLNLYNILILHVVMSGDQIQSIMEKQDFFQGFRYQLKPHAFSLDEIEHGILRANTPSFRKLRKPLRRRHPAYLHIMNPLDPRVHMAFHCACLSSAPLRVFNPESIEKELESASSDFLSRHVSLLENQLSLPRCFYWYKKDFGQKFGLLNFIEKHHPDPQIKQQIGHQGNRIKIHFTEFDWTLNSMEK